VLIVIGSLAVSVNLKLGSVLSVRNFFVQVVVRRSVLFLKSLHVLAVE